MVPVDQEDVSGVLGPIPSLLVSQGNRCERAVGSLLGRAGSTGWVSSVWTSYASHWAPGHHEDSFRSAGLSRLHLPAQQRVSTTAGFGSEFDRGPGGGAGLRVAGGARAGLTHRELVAPKKCCR